MPMRLASEEVPVVALVSNKREFIFKAVADMYTDVARHPLKGFHFPTGRLACLFVGYPATRSTSRCPTARSTWSQATAC